MSKNFWQGCQISFYMSRGPFWGIIYFSGKSRFFSIIFECWVIFFWRVRHNCMLRVRILLEGKQFFSKIFFTTFRKWASFFPAFGKKTSAGCHEGNPHVRKNGLRLKFVWKKGFFYFGFVHWGKDFLPSEKNWVKCHKCSLHAHWYSLMKIFVWKFLFFCRFWTFRDNIPAFCPKIFKTAVGSAFNCPKENFEEIVSLKKSVFPILTK